MLYPKNNAPELSRELFENPTSEYRGTPFWAWNGRLNKERLSMEISMLREMGLGGFHMHVRTGMDSPYLSEEFMDYIRYCTDLAEEKGMLAWLYDEDRWPSGTAGGKVTDGHPELVRRNLLLTPEPYAPSRPHRAEKPEPGRGQESVRQDNGELLTVYDIRLNPDGTLAEWRQIGEKDPAVGDKWYAYVEYCADDPWFNNHPYPDTLNPEATRRFLEITHDAYFKALGDRFGKTVPAIFTDEPCRTYPVPLPFAREKADVFLPWTDRLPELFRERCGGNLTDVLPELVWELPNGKLSRNRWQFYNLLADLFAENYCGMISQWCRDHSLAFTGHMNGEDTLESQTGNFGEAMRCYPYEDIPGIDMLCDFRNFNTAKQTQSVVRQNGKRGMLSELYGVTGWDYDFRGYKLQGDWQAALGVTVRVPHLTWMTMKGEAKRDYPACIGYQSPWWKKFSVIEDHFARLNTALTRGKAIARIAVVHPLESYWLHCGPSEQTANARLSMDSRFAELTRILLSGQLDFDFISEALLPGQCPEGGAPLRVGEMAYEAVLVCGSRTLRSSTLERLEAFRRQGGRLIFVGDCPDYLDAIPSDGIKPLWNASERVSFSAGAILGALEEFRLIDIRNARGERCENLLCQLRQDGEKRWLFVANAENPVCPDVEDAPVCRFTLTGHFRLTEYDTLSGEIRPLPAEYRDGKTCFSRAWHMHDSLLLCLEEGTGAEFLPEKDQPVLSDAPELILHPVEVALEEPNMLLLDEAEWAMDGGDWNPLEELLRLDNAARDALGIPRRRKEILQPYLLKEEKCTHSLRLRFTIPSEIEVPDPMLGMEEPEQAEIRLNGEAVSLRDCGWFVDMDIRKISLPALHPGRNTLEIRLPIGSRTNLECFYLLGDFGVRVNGVVKTVTAPVRRLGFGDIVPQGLPFYTGNLSYTFPVRTGEKGLAVRIPAWRGGLVSVLVDGRDAGNIAFSPYRLELPDLPAGEHILTLKLYGTRQNGFAQLHHTPGSYFYQSPNSWRSDRDRWSYEYHFKPMGILKSPELYGTGRGREAAGIVERS